MGPCWMPAGNDQEGLEYVLSQLAESIKTVEREKYVRWVFADTIDQSDWEARRRIAATYLTKYKDFLSPELREYGPCLACRPFPGLDFQPCVNAKLVEAGFWL